MKQIPWQFDPDRALYEKFERRFARELAHELMRAHPRMHPAVWTIVDALLEMSRPTIPETGTETADPSDCQAVDLQRDGNNS
jgi:hypothetical protein